jgi:hypothetical protein
LFFSTKIQPKIENVSLATEIVLFGSVKNISYEIGDILECRVTNLPFKIVEIVTLNNIPHVRLRCQAMENNTTKTIATGALEMNFEIAQGDGSTITSTN